MPWMILVVVLVVIGLILGLRRVRRAPDPSQSSRANVGYHDVERSTTRDRMGGGTL
jgi:hypothetical protein